MTLVRVARTFALVALLLVLAVACANRGGPDAAGEDGTDSVTFALAWLPVAEAAGWYSAWDQGWFEEENIDVEIARGFGSGDTAQRVATGEAEFGVVDMSALVPMKVEEGLPVVAIAAYFAEPFHGVTYRVDAGIEEPGDLEGRSIGCSAGSAMMLLFPVFAAAVGIDADAVEWTMIEPASVIPTFVGGQTDAACQPVSELPIVEAQTDDEVGHFAFADYGVSLYSQMLVTTERMIEERPDLVERFNRAALRGLEFAVENPEEAVDILLAHESDPDPELSHEAWSVILELGLMTSEEIERHGIGHISAERMEATFETLVEVGDLDPGGYTAEDFYTTDFLP